MALFNEIRIVKWSNDYTSVEVYNDGKPVELFAVYDLNSESSICQGVKAIVTAIEKETL